VAALYQQSTSQREKLVRALGASGDPPVERAATLPGTRYHGFVESLLGDGRLTDTCYRYQELDETDGELALQEIDRRKPCVKNRVEAAIEAAVVVKV
jgi:hypothetical protein